MALLVSEGGNRTPESARPGQTSSRSRKVTLLKGDSAALKVLFTLASIWLSVLHPVAVKAQAISREYHVKAVFLYNFVQFTEWPTNAFANSNSPIVIGILGASDPFGKVIDETVRGETVRNRSIIIQRYKRVEEIKECHVLFITQSESSRLNKIFSALRGRSILTVADLDGFAQKGGMIEFSTERNKIRLSICVGATKAAGLTLSSKLLRIADLVANEGG